MKKIFLLACLLVAFFSSDSFATTTELSPYQRYEMAVKLIQAAKAGDIATLVKNKAYLNLQNDCGSTPLIEAAFAGQLKSVQALIDLGADMEIFADGEEMNALHRASEAGHTEIVQCMLEKGANVDAMSWSGLTPLMLAAGQGHTEIMQLLLANGADIDAQFISPENKLASNTTALMDASVNGQTEAVKLLLANNADRTKESCEHKTALTYAKERGHTEIVHLFSAIKQKATNSSAKSFTLALSNVQGYNASFSMQITESRDSIVVAYPISINQEADESKIIVDFFDKNTGSFSGRASFIGTLVENSLEYNQDADLLQCKIHQDIGYSIATFKQTDLISYDMLPDNLTNTIVNDRYASFDGTPELAQNTPNSAWWAISNSNEGIYLEPIAGNNNEARFISNKIIMQQGKFGGAECKPPYFGDVRILNDGKTLVSTVVYEMAQSGNVGMYIYHIESGQEYWYDDVFSAMVATVDYFDNKTVIARGDDSSTVIKLDTNETHIVENLEFTFYETYDYQRYFAIKNENKESILYYIDTFSNKEKVLKKFDHKSFLLGVSENFVIVRVNNNECIAIAYQ